MQLARPRRSTEVAPEAAAPEVAIVCHQPYSPLSNTGPGIVTINGMLHIYEPSREGWVMTEAGSGRAHNITGRLDLVTCTCRDFYESRNSGARKMGKCLHQLALVLGQKTYRVFGLDIEITFHVPHHVQNAQKWEAAS